MELSHLRTRLRGSVTAPTDPGYEHLRRSLVWHLQVPERRPRAIVRVADVRDVIETVRFARANHVQLAVRGGGHSWVGFSLRDDALLIDLERLDRAAIDAKARRATVQPALRGREFNRLLAAQGLAFPVGHCPTVPMSGFILNGGLGWNSNAWGPACFSVEEAKVVTADGELMTASAEQNPDLLWAVRGGGPGFFGAIVEYSLRLYPAPGAIVTSNYFYPLDCAQRIGAWSGPLARRLPRRVELTVMIAAAPPALADRCRSGNGFAMLVSATAFAASANEAASDLEALDSCPAADACLLKEANLPTPIDALLDMGGMAWPERHHFLADTLWTDSSLGEVLASARDRFLEAPSAKSLLVSVPLTGERAPLPDAAYSMSADALLLCYAVWDDESDGANARWHRATTAALDRFAVGHYVGESDIAADPRRAERCYAPAAWKRLQELRRKYDPDGLFAGHFA